MIRAILEKIFSFINSFRLNDYEKIIESLAEGLNEVLDENDDSFNIDLYYFYEFDEETISAVEKSEPGITKDGDEIVAFTYIDDDGDIDIVFSLEAIKRYVAKENPLNLKSEIRGVARHEAYHVRQYRYIYERSGIEGVNRLFDDIQKLGYEENVLEIGAYLFQYFGLEQDFEEEFTPYVSKVCA